MEGIVSNIRKRYLKAFSSYVKSAKETPFFTSDLVVIGVIDRSIGLVEAMPALIASENIHAFAPLLRVQLDGLLRLHALRIVKDRESLAGHIVKGNSLRDYRSDGKRLTDRYLVNSLKDELPWVESMYDTLCGWVHFSESHIFSSVSEGKEDRTIEIGIGEYRKKLKPQLLKETIGATEAVHNAIATIAEAYFALPRHL
ncbi:hypothetical protein [Aestuariibacter salexigens]|uniref:hypothetical protein n=1 Tax=Aestuariibacter salexigens TaxID=226010 RepID=UPI00047D958E|nr:hypothetical protein [Aestuariibacter salexigens]